MRRIIGCNVPDADWGPPGGMTESEQIAWRAEVDKAVTGAWTAIIEEALTLRNAWEQIATPVWSLGERGWRRVEGYYGCSSAHGVR